MTFYPLLPPSSIFPLEAPFLPLRFIAKSSFGGSGEKKVGEEKSLFTFVLVPHKEEKVTRGGNRVLQSHLLN